MKSREVWRAFAGLIVFALFVGTATGCRPASTEPKSEEAVARVVFVGKKEACDCTRKTITTSRDALQDALGSRAELPVEELALDADADAVAIYQEMSPIVALPALYFVDSEGKLVSVLQGELTADQIREVLGQPETSSRSL